jgi:hypothetical protein
MLPGPGAMSRVSPQLPRSLATLLLASASTLLLAASCSLAGLTDPLATASSSGGAGAGATLPSSSTGAGTVYEAENATLYGKFVILAGEHASAGKYVEVPSEAGCGDGLSVAAFDVAVDAENRYVILATASADSGLHDSFYVSVDNGPEVAFTVSNQAKFVEAAVNDSFSDASAPIRYPLDAGSHQILFKCREDGTQLDRIRLDIAPP